MVIVVLPITVGFKSQDSKRTRGQNCQALAPRCCMHTKSWRREAAPTLYLSVESMSELFDLPTEPVVVILVQPLVLGLGLRNEYLLYSTFMPSLGIALSRFWGRAQTDPFPSGMAGHQQNFVIFFPDAPVPH